MLLGTGRSGQRQADSVGGGMGVFDSKAPGGGVDEGLEMTGRGGGGLGREGGHQVGMVKSCRN